VNSLAGSKAATIDCYEGGEGSPLVLLHGLSASWHVWRPLLSILERQHRLFAPTLPGHPGGAPWPAGREANLDAIVDVLAEDLAQRKIDRPHIAGNSLGGLLALELARRGIAASVTALSPAGAWRNDRDYLAVARPFRIAHALMPLMIAAARPLLRFSGVRRALNAQAMVHGDRVPADEVLRAMQSMAGTSILPQLLTSMRRDGPIKPLAVNEIPVTIAWCEYDRVIPFETYGAPMLEKVPGAQAETVKGAGHVPMYDEPQQVADMILATVSKAGGPRA
jgi:pimeloyl-ACP methyl ester carboxylesterase